MALNLHIDHVEDILGVAVRAIVDEQVIGFLLLTGSFEHIDGGRFVRNIMVDEKYRRQGVATKLWDYAVENGFKPRHDAEKTADGVAWASSVECKCSACIETDLYGRGYCQECYDQGCDVGEGHK